MGFGDGGIGGGGLVAARAATRMRSRQQYRTMSRMQRRRSWAEEKVGARQDFEPAGQEEEAAPAAAAPAASDYTAELEKLADLRDKGIISPEDFEAKKNQLLGI
jgi:putative oligomerization/nucleic acid binding protein